MSLLTEESISISQEGDWLIIVLSPSSLDLLQHCELAYYYGKILRLKQIDSSRRLEEGSIFHRLLEQHYNLIINGVDYAKIVDDVQQSINLLAINESDLEEKDIENVRRVYLKYAAFYADDRFVPVAVEGPFSYLLHEDKERKIKIVLEGRIDLIVETQNGQELIVMDHKTKERQSQYCKLDNQPSVYSLVAETRTVQINEIGFQKEPIFRRVPLFYDSAYWAEYKAIIIKWVTRLLNNLSTGQWLANPSSCKYCNFRQICESEASARDFKIQTFYKRGAEFDVFKDKIVEMEAKVIE